jgi:hypothetical protein
MYAFLLILGTVIAAAGVVLIGPGLPFGGRDYDPSIVTPGAVAIVGGLILIGLALAVRVLGRIEKALAARPLPHPVLQEEVATPAVEEPAAAAPARIPFPPKPVAEPAPPPAPAVATARVLPEDAALERLREKFPTLVRLENAPVVEDADVSLSPKPSVRADETVAETNDAVAYRTNGAAPARIEPRLEVQARPASRPERAKNFEAFWPKKQRPGREAQAPAAPQPIVQQPAVQQPAAPAPPVEPLLTPEPVQFQFREPAPELRPVAPAPMASAPMASAPMAPAPEAQATITILKSGVVDGMAYTLYSDGSIEAQLPQGTLRFGSITELRNHIEQSA